MDECVVARGCRVNPLWFPAPGGLTRAGDSRDCPRTCAPIGRSLRLRTARAIAVLARVQQDAVWNRLQAVNQVRSLLREYYPAALDAFLGKQHGLPRAEACAVLATAPTPARAARLHLTQLRPRTSASRPPAGNRRRGRAPASIPGLSGTCSNR